MTDLNFRKDNHYVSQAYLRHWESSPGKVFVYHILVSHKKVPLWHEKSIKGIAYHQHLYTKHISGAQSDEIEQWFSTEFESPAELSIKRVINEEPLTPDDWHKLVRFLAMQDVRTPARLEEFLKRHPAESVQETLEEILRSLPEKLDMLKQNRAVTPSVDKSNTDFPLKLTTEIIEGKEVGIIKAETAVGRALWLSGIQHQLNNTVKVLHQHKWTIMHPARGMSWFTTDKPVIRLNYDSLRKYNFNGGWGTRGTEILLPLSPEHMLYTRIGHRPPIRGSRFSVEITHLLCRLIAEHAHRYIFGKAADTEVPIYRPRTVDAEYYKFEQEQWQRWHAEQTESEEYLFTSDTGDKNS